MIISRSIILTTMVAVACLWAIWEYRISASANSRSNAGPDVIVGDIPSIFRWGVSGNETAFSIGTTSCNIGTARLDWIENSTLHPVISQNMYRVKDGRMEQIGMSWLKHGFGVAAGNLCGNCTDPAWNYLGVGCSDPYGASLNGGQSYLGPRSQVNATTGVFVWPKTNLPQSGTLPGRLRVLTSDINPAQNAGARYFVESMYVHPQDAASGNSDNNTSYREAFVSSVSGGWTMQVNGGSPTVRMQPAINAWKTVHPDVKLFVVDIPNDGRVIVGMRTTPIAGGYHTEFAIENLNSHQSIRSLGVKYGSNAISNPGFNDVDYQFEPYSGTDWTPNIVGNEIEWSTETFATNQNANALRWNTLYSFWCDSELPPRSLTLGMFRPGTVAEMNLDLIESVVPETFELEAGVATGGQFENVFLSDDEYFRLNPSGSSLPAKVVLHLEAVSSTNSPTDFAFRLESILTPARADNVIQMIELLNHDTGQYEVIDVRPATRFEQSLEITPTGDWSRFIQNKTNAVHARIEWRNLHEARNAFTWYVDIDEAVWLIAE